MTLNEEMMLHDIATGLLLSDVAIHILSTEVVDKDTGSWGKQVVKVLNVKMRNGDEWEIAANKSSSGE